MASTGREAWITGIGLASCLGEGAQAHWDKLLAAHPTADADFYPPYLIHRITPLNLDAQIPKKSDQRQMEAWQRIGTYVAGLALQSADLKGRSDLLSHVDMIVAAGGGERDVAVDCGILGSFPDDDGAGAFLNERLMSDLRPTLFLAQLPNLLAGNISIVHGVTGSSRTFMGEEAAGVDAVRIALSRILAGQSDIALVGGAHNAERPEQLLLYGFGDFMLKAPYTPVWERGPKGGFALGSLGAFLVIEERGHAQRRGVKPLARLASVVSAHSNRQPSSAVASLDNLWAMIEPRLRTAHAAVLSGATGAEPVTAEERKFLSNHSGIAVRATGSYVGHGLEAQFPMNIALAAIALNQGALFPPADASGLEKPMTEPLRQVVVTSVGHWRGEGLALVEAVN